MNGRANPALDLRERWLRGWRDPQSFTCLLPTRTDATVQELRKTLSAREPDILQALAGLKHLHAHRIVVVPPDNGYGPRLLINSVTEATLPDHATDISAALWPWLHDLLDAMENAYALRERMVRHRLLDNTVFLAHQGLTLAEVRKEARLREVLRSFFAQARERGEPSLVGDDVRELDMRELDMRELERLRLEARVYVQRLDDVTCAGTPPPRPQSSHKRWLDLALTLVFFPLTAILAADILETVAKVNGPVRRALTWVGLALWAIWAAPFAAVAMLFVRLSELLEKDHVPEPASSDKIACLEAIEEGRRKNELTIWFPVKPTPVGRLLMWLMLFGSERGTRHLWTRGALAGARNIHFARLVLADRGRRMIFMSDYEGSFDAYMNHFIGVGGHTRAVVPISSRVYGCPPTRWLYWPVDVVSFRRRWRQMARSYQLQASVRYVAYPDLSANDIITHRVIRVGLFASELTPKALLEWARKI